VVRFLTLLVVAIGASALMGCGDQTGAAAIAQGSAKKELPPPVSSDSLPLVDHPEYVHWSQFPVGTAVVRKKEVTNDHGAVRVTTKVRLAEKTAEKVVVETQVTVDRLNGTPEENPPFNAEFVAKFRLPSSVKLEQFSLPSLRAKPAGEETRAACGREYRAEVFTWEERNETGPMSVKLWRSNEVPGRMIRQEIEGHMHHSVEEVVEISVPST